MLNKILSFLLTIFPLVSPRNICCSAAMCCLLCSSQTVEADSGAGKHKNGGVRGQQTEPSQTVQGFFKLPVWLLSGWTV